MNFKSLWLGSNTSLLIKTETITINTFLPMKNKFVYFCSIKIHASGFSELLESIFCLLLVVEALFLQKVVEMLEEVVVGWQEVRWMWRMRQNFVAQFIQLLKSWLYNVARRCRGELDACCRCSRFQCISSICCGEGNGTPLQYSCLENPIDGGAW